MEPAADPLCSLSPDLSSTLPPAAPIDLPPVLSVELIQITDKTSIPYAAKASKTLEEIKKKEEERLVSEQAPPAQKKKKSQTRFLYLMI